MVKIFIDPGHGGHDSGATGYGLKEKDLTLTIAKKIKSILDEVATVKLSRTTDSYLTLTERTNMANKWKADYYMSIHINAGGGTGFETYIYNGLSDNSTAAKIQSIVHENIMKQIGNVTDRGKKKANFAVVRQSNMPAILTENLFIDRKEDAEKLKDRGFLDKLAKGHAYGIGIALGLGTPLEYASQPKPSKKPTKKPSKTTTNKSNYTGNSLVDYLKSIKANSSFANRKKLAEQHGIKGYRGTATENLTLLRKLRSGYVPTASKINGDMKTNSIVDYLKSIKADSSYGNRKKLAAKHGIKNYKGTASQNATLLKKLRGK